MRNRALAFNQKHACTKKNDIKKEVPDGHPFLYGLSENYSTFKVTRLKATTVSSLDCCFRY